MITNEEKLVCVRREIAMRKKVYPRWVEAGRMRQEQADREIEVMQAVADDYRALAEKDRLI